MGGCRPPGGAARVKRPLIPASEARAIARYAALAARGADGAQPGPSDQRHDMSYGKAEHYKATHNTLWEAARIVLGCLLLVAWSFLTIPWRLWQGKKS